MLQSKKWRLRQTCVSSTSPFQKESGSALVAAPIIALLKIPEKSTKSTTVPSSGAPPISFFGGNGISAVTVVRRSCRRSTGSMTAFTSLIHCTLMYACPCQSLCLSNRLPSRMASLPLWCHRSLTLFPVLHRIICRPFLPLMNSKATAVRGIRIRNAGIRQSITPTSWMSPGILSWISFPL